MAQQTAVHPWVAGGRERTRFGLSVAIPPDFSRARDFVQAAEALGFDSVWLPDHPTLGWDSWTNLAALATATKTIRLGTMVSCVYYRNPVVLARVVADVDRISGGRVILGIGSGDLPSEFQQMGLEFPGPKQRAAVLEEGLKIVPALLRGETVEFSGEALSVHGATLRPHAVQQPYVPILVAGGGEKTTLRLVAEYADASNMGAATWAGGAFNGEDAKRKLAVLNAHCESVGRPPEAVLRTYQIGFVLADTPEQAASMRDTAMANPARRRMMTFLENVVNFCTPADAVERLLELRQTGFDYFIGGAGFGAGELERFAREVVDPVRSAEKV